jgi:hypothetical protein
MMKRWIVLLLVLVLAACNGNGNDDESEDADPQELMNEAAQQIDDAETFQIQLKVEGAPVSLNAESIGVAMDLNFKSAVADFVSPDRLGGNVEVQLEDSVVDFVVRVIGEEQYVQLPSLLGGGWQNVRFLSDFNPSQLVGDAGIAAALRSVQNVELVGEEELDGLPVYHLRGTIEAGLVRAVTVGLIGTEEGSLPIDLYIRRRDNRLETFRIVEPAAEEGGDTTTWTISLYDYNEDMSVEVPDIE